MSNKLSSVLVLAAGLSERMGQDKLALEFMPGITFLEHIAKQYHQFGCGKIVVVVNTNARQLIDKLIHQIPFEIEIAVNPDPLKGRFSSIKTGSNQLKEEDYVFIQNVDNPSIYQNTLSLLLDNIGDADYTYPSFQGRGGHPVLIRNNIVQAILAEKADDLILKNFLSRYNKALTEVNTRSVLVNINTIEEYHRWRTD